MEHIKANSKGKNIWLDSIGGHSEHLHCMISLNREISIKDTMQLIKGESSHWINASKLIKEKFNWQDDYWMVGVSESHLESVRAYIENQDAHHLKNTFKQEIEEFMKKYGWEKLND
ncbi:MAG: transposase [Saprospiraceae bacterium]